MNIEAAALELREELNEIAAVDDCAACECLLGIAARALADLRRLPGDEARDAEDDVRRILVAGRREPHDRAEHGRERAGAGGANARQRLQPRVPVDRPHAGRARGVHRGGRGWCHAVAHQTVSTSGRPNRPVEEHT